MTHKSPLSLATASRGEGTYCLSRECFPSPAAREKGPGIEGHRLKMWVMIRYMHGEGLLG